MKARWYAELKGVNMLWNVITAVVAALAFLLSLYNAIYNWARNHRKKVDFWAEITRINEVTAAGGANEPDKSRTIDSRMVMNVVNKGCPITLLGVYFDEAHRTAFKMDHDFFPVRLDRGAVLKIKEPFHPPVNREKIESKDVFFYLIDASEKKHPMRKIPRIANPEFPNVTRPGVN